MSKTNRSDQWAISVSLGGTPLGIFDNKTGGQVDSDEVKYRPGGMSDQISLGGATSVDNLVLQRNYDIDRDHGILDVMLAAVGKGRVRVSLQPLDADANVYGKPLVYTGVLKRCQPPDINSNSNDVAMLELEVTVDGKVTVNA